MYNGILKIGTVEGCHGGLYVMMTNNKSYWVIDISHWEDLDKELYEALMAFEERIKNKQNETRSL